MKKIACSFQPPMESLAKSQKTLFELLKDRGYNVPFPLINKEDSRDINEVKKEMQMIVEGPRGKLLVRWPYSPKLSSDECTSLMACLKEHDLHNAIIIIDVAVTPHVKNTLRLARRKGDIIEIFTMTEMQYNVSKHELVPKHIICSSAEQKKIKKVYGSKLPQIKASDPQMRYLGARKGQVIKIIRDSSVLHGEKTVYYREVN